MIRLIDKIKYWTTEVSAGNLFLGLAMNEGIVLEDESKIQPEMCAVLRSALNAAYELEQLTLREYLGIGDRDATTAAVNATMLRRELTIKINRRDSMRLYHDPK